ncbi:hypothetical protein V2I01_43180 [Micromonospora sp. BRA006-A]|nr:hypothetical protein [Micromonospora sp. BRA006-A]
MTAAPLDASVKDVGTRGEPSVDSIVALQPDLVVMEAERGPPSSPSWRSTSRCWSPRAATPPTTSAGCVRT